MVSSHFQSYWVWNAVQTSWDYTLMRPQSVLGEYRRTLHPKAQSSQSLKVKQTDTEKVRYEFLIKHKCLVTSKHSRSLGTRLLIHVPLSISGDQNDTQGRSLLHYKEKWLAWSRLEHKILFIKRSTLSLKEEEKLGRTWRTIAPGWKSFPLGMLCIWQTLTLFV